MITVDIAAAFVAVVILLLLGIVAGVFVAFWVATWLDAHRESPFVREAGELARKRGGR